MLSCPCCSWVFTPNSGSKKGELGTRALYDPKNSTTSHVINSSSWSISYGTPHLLDPLHNVPANIQQVTAATQVAMFTKTP